MRESWDWIIPLAICSFVAVIYYRWGLAQGRGKQAKNIDGFKIGRLVVYFTPDGGFVRIGKRGLSWKDTTQHRMLFSERNRLIPFLRIGKWLIKGVH